MVKSKDEWTKLLQCNFREQFQLRDKHIANIGFPILTEEVLFELNNILLGKKVVEVGAGTGYLAAQLKASGIDIQAFDTYQSHYFPNKGLGSFKPTYFPVKNKDATKLHFSKYDAVIMSWPDYESDFAEIIVKRMRRGQILIYQGEGYYGCTGNDIFHEFLEKNFEELHDINDHHVQFYGIHDHWNIYQKISN